jgi:hypothetical protein
VVWRGVGERKVDKKRMEEKTEVEVVGIPQAAFVGMFVEMTEPVEGMGKTGKVEQNR